MKSGVRSDADKSALRMALAKQRMASGEKLHSNQLLLALGVHLTFENRVLGYTRLDRKMSWGTECTATGCGCPFHIKHVTVDKIIPLENQKTDAATYLADPCARMAAWNPELRVVFMDQNHHTGVKNGNRSHMNKAKAAAEDSLVETISIIAHDRHTHEHKTNKVSLPQMKPHRAAYSKAKINAGGCKHALHCFMPWARDVDMAVAAGYWLMIHRSCFKRGVANHMLRKERYYQFQLYLINTKQAEWACKPCHWLYTVCERASMAMVTGSTRSLESMAAYEVLTQFPLGRSWIADFKEKTEGFDWRIYAEQLRTARLLEGSERQYVTMTDITGDNIDTTDDDDEFEEMPCEEESESDDE
jgi:hypothetical protein